MRTLTNAPKFSDSTYLELNLEHLTRFLDAVGRILVIDNAGVQEVLTAQPVKKDAGGIGISLARARKLIQKVHTASHACQRGEFRKSLDQ